MPLSLLAVFAHPDDEVFSGGTLAHYASLGVKVTLVCATKGDAGKVTDPELKVSGPEELAALRADELGRAAELLGEARDLDPLLYGVSDDTVAVRLDVTAQQEKKQAALAAHRSQMGPTSRMAQMTDEAKAKFEGFFGSEAFALGGFRGPLELPLRGLFDGLGLGVI